MATEIDAARLLIYRASWMKDRGMKVTAQSSMAKLYAGEVAVRVANECVQIHGGYGFIKDYPAEKFYRDVKLCTIGEGTNAEIQQRGHRKRVTEGVTRFSLNEHPSSGIFSKAVRVRWRAFITRVENRTAGQPGNPANPFSQHTGRARVIGITGSPGAGKSSLVDRLAIAYRRQEKTVGIIAVDPSSPFTGGAILGDRIRMQTLGIDPGIYIRSMATRGHLGGLATATADVVSVLDAAGKNPVIVETVGVGQDEIEIVKLADISVVVLVPGMGDDIQALKAGIMEIGDIFVINKCDRAGVEKMERSVMAMLSLAHRHDDWMPPIVKTIATKGDGIDELIGGDRSLPRILSNRKTPP